MSEGDTFILGVDPGTTTGLCVLKLDRERDGEPSAIWGDQLDWHEACERISWWLERLYERQANQDARVAAVCEKFIINANTARRGQQGCEDALGIIGVVRYICKLTTVEFVDPQQASAAKPMVDDDVLRRLHLHSPGLVHVNDAYRHAIFLAAKRSWMSRGWLVTQEEPRGVKR